MFCAVAICHAEIAVIDDVHQTVSIDRPARRIIAVAPNLAELTYAAGAGKWLIATVRGTNYPAAASDLPIVGDAAGLDFEQILRMKPDLVLAWGSGNKPADLERLGATGVAVVVLEARTLNDIPRHIRIIGRLAGSDDTAQAAALRFETTLAQFQAKRDDACVVDVFVEIWNQPLFTVGPSHPLSDALQLCGARNALRSYPLLAGPVPLEDVLVASADAILSVTGSREGIAQARWDGLLPAPGGRHIPVVVIAPDLLVRSGPRMLDGIELLCARLDALREDVCRNRRADQ
jgi:iron complex transport system substrate-binding protein